MHVVFADYGKLAAGCEELLPTFDVAQQAADFAFSQGQGIVVREKTQFRLSKFAAPNCVHEFEFETQFVDPIAYGFATVDRRRQIDYVEWKTLLLTDFHGIESIFFAKRGRRGYEKRFMHMV
jgi:hypothetical protein